MLKSLLTKLVGDPNVKEIGRLQPIVEAINALEPEMQRRSAEELRELTASFRASVAAATADTREQLAAVAVKNHDNGSRNPLAQFPFKITVDGVLNSVLVADPLRILDCSPITDGAAAVVLCPADMARKMKKPVVRIVGCGQATDTMALASRKDLTWLESTHIAAGKALAMAGRKLDEIDLFEVHDCFTIAEIMVTEALGLVEKGRGGKAVEEGLTARDGRFPVNPSGGLKAKGHPVGATGVAQAVEVVKQLRGEAGERQNKGARRGLTQNMGGTGGSSVVHIFEAE